ncbi:MAG: hypothetical protein AB8B85_21645 [Paracoccaceae bacterium]
MIHALAWAGARARWVLALGVLAALVIPGPGSLLEGTIPFWVAFLFGLAMMRIDLVGVARQALAPRRLARNTALAAGLMCATPALFWALGTGLGLPEQHVAALVYTSAAPPLGSGAAFCLMVGFNAAFAIELTVFCSALAPLTLPLMAQLLLGGAVPIDTGEMAIRLAFLIGLASAGALAARFILGDQWIKKRALSLDGLSSVILVLFLFPLFDGLTTQIVSAPIFALGVLALAIAANLGVQVVLFPLTRRIAGFATGGATALIWGNRNAALALASLPPDPVLWLYVALYQFPMYFTPLVMSRIAGPPPET